MIKLGNASKLAVVKLVKRMRVKQITILEI